MTPYDQAAAYLAAIPPAVSGNGGHAQAFTAARALVWGFNLPAADARRLLSDWNRSCSPPWSERELDHKLAEAERTPFAKPRGHLLKGSRTRRTAATSAHTAHVPPALPAPVIAQRRYDLTEATGTDLPEPIPDGCRALLRHCFQPGESIRIVRARLNEDGKEVPDGDGPTLTLEQWLKKLDAKKGDPNGIFSSTKKTGIYICLNPLKPDGSKDADVTTFRHTLVEFDHIPPEEQLTLYQKSNLPCAAIIYSGKSSVHAWVKIDAKDRQEYDERVATVYAHFSAYGVDAKNKNPSRLSRLPNCIRFDSRQELLALNAGAASFTEWATDIEVADIGRTYSFRQVFDYLPDDDGKTLTGNRWLRKGGSCLFIGPSGVGKSSLVQQMIIHWALGRPTFGIAPARPIKTLVVQAENDESDMHEMISGVCDGMGINFDSVALATLESNLVFNRNFSHTGRAFTEALRKLIQKHKPDLVVLDPLLSFIGADISRQEVCSEFLRNWINPIADSTGVAWLMVHHTGKPPTDKDARRGWQSSDWSYSALGSSELINWTRASMVLQQRGDVFELKLAKRGKRAGATNMDGSPASCLWLRWSQDGIYWHQVEAPEEAEKKSDSPKQPKEKAPTKPEQIRGMNLHTLIQSIPEEGEGLRAMCRRIIDWAASSGQPKLIIGKGTAERALELLIADDCGKLTSRDGLYFRGQNA